MLTMADGSEHSQNRQTQNDDSDTEDPVQQPLQPDLGDDSNNRSDRLGSHHHHRNQPNNNNKAGPSAPGPWSDPSRDNPFSFKHFLRGSDSSSTSSTNHHNYYQNRGARPKVFCDGRPICSVSDLDFQQESVNSGKQTRLEYPSSATLPDFVQDHLVVEQCYMGGDDDEDSSHDRPVNLPDFAPSRDSINVNRINIDSSHSNIRRSNSSEMASIPLDLPPHFLTNPSLLEGLPLDLPPANNGTNGCGNEVGVSNSLPDFLADGAARTQPQLDGQPFETPEGEVERLRRELAGARGQLFEQTRRAEALSRELEVSRNKEHDYTQNLAKALEQVEKNLERSNKRSNTAENTVIKLRQEIKLLEVELNNLRAENRALRGEEGAAGGHPDYFAPHNDHHSHRLAQELKAAASTAEHSLRQLLTGVDNLRIMAASLENMHRIEERHEPFLNLDDDDTGPAL